MEKRENKSMLNEKKMCAEKEMWRYWSVCLKGTNTHTDVVTGAPFYPCERTHIPIRNSSFVVYFCWIDHYLLVFVQQFNNADCQNEPAFRANDCKVWTSYFVRYTQRYIEMFNVVFLLSQRLGCFHFVYIYDKYAIIANIIAIRITDCVRWF